jgi:putative transposase
VLREDYLKWMNRPINQSIRYLFLDAINLKVKRHWLSKEALLCAIGFTAVGKKECLGFMLGGRESTTSWEKLLLLLLQRGLVADQLTMVAVDGNAGLLSVLGSLLPGVAIQRCIVHKIRNIVSKCPRSLRAIVPTEAKQMFYTTSQVEARERFYEFKNRWQQSLHRLWN